MRAAVLTADQEPPETQDVDRPDPDPDGVVAGVVAMTDYETVGIPVVDQFA